MSSRNPVGRVMASGDVSRSRFCFPVSPHGCPTTQPTAAVSNSRCLRQRPDLALGARNLRDVPQHPLPPTRRRQTPGWREAHEFFTDLNLDQIVDLITAGRREDDLRPFFFTPLTSVETIHYRHDILRDLEDRTLVDHLRSFAEALRAMRSHLARAQKLHYKYQRLRWFLDAVDLYCAAVGSLAHDLTLAGLRSPGFLDLREYVTAYTQAAEFTSLCAEAASLVKDLSGIAYGLRLTGNQVKVTRYESEVDYGAEIGQSFAKFRRGAVKDYRFTFPDWVDMNYVELAVLEMVAGCTRRPSRLWSTSPIAAVITSTPRSALSTARSSSTWRSRIHSGPQSGRTSVRPSTVTDRSKNVHAHEAFDLAGPTS